MSLISLTETGGSRPRADRAEVRPCDRLRRRDRRRRSCLAVVGVAYGARKTDAFLAPSAFDLQAPAGGG
jgi:hypothetical protein